jgi:predicted nucleic acid-binding protein
VSKFAPGRPGVSEALSQWMVEQGAQDALYISAMTVAEISKGVERLKRKGATVKAQSLEDWLSGMIDMFDDRILAMDLPVSLIVGRLEDHAVGRGHAPDLADVIIAATAERHGLTVVTENIKHFLHFGIEVERPIA